MGKRGVSADTYKNLWEGLLDPEDAEPNSFGVGGDSFTEVATLVLGLGDGNEVYQMEEVLTKPPKAWHCEKALTGLKRVRWHWKGTHGPIVLDFLL